MDKTNTGKTGQHQYLLSPPTDDDNSTSNDSAGSMSSQSPETKKSQLHVMPGDSGKVVPSAYELDPPTLSNKKSKQDKRLSRPTSPSEKSLTATVRRKRTPPRNKEGLIYCDHEKCQGKKQTFRRACEWNKHMDRHERPYKCREVSCAGNLGFTYPGGLLRHQREVHKMSTTAWEELYCPFPNCNRGAANGHGFTRKENLEEHKRRRHVEEEEVWLPKLVREVTNAKVMQRQRQPSPRHDIDDDDDNSDAKRRKLSTSTEGQVTNTILPLSNLGLSEASQPLSQPQPQPQPQPPPNYYHQLQQMIQHMQGQVAQKEEYIRRQAAEIHRLQTFIRSLPPQQVYGVALPPQLPGGGGMS